MLTKRQAVPEQMQHYFNPQVYTELVRGKINKKNSWLNKKPAGSIKKKTQREPDGWECLAHLVKPKQISSQNVTNQNCIHRNACWYSDQGSSLPNIEQTQTTYRGSKIDWSQVGVSDYMFRHPRWQQTKYTKAANYTEDPEAGSIGRPAQ